MKIILQKPVDNLGGPGDIAEVADGYARNFLIPRGFAIRAEKGALKHAESLARSHKLAWASRRASYEALAQQAHRRRAVQIAARAARRASSSAPSRPQTSPRRSGSHSRRPGRQRKTSISRSRSARWAPTRSRCSSSRRSSRS